MKQFITFINQNNEIIKDIFKGIFMGGILIIIFVYLLFVDLSTAPEFIYNQF